MIKVTSADGKVVSEVKGSTKEVLADLAAIIVSVMQGIGDGNPAVQALHEKALVTAYLIMSSGDSDMVKFDRSGKGQADDVPGKV